jgi:phospholipid/cholesterol/gamma-HCH transport system permease protein
MHFVLGQIELLGGFILQSLEGLGRVTRFLNRFFYWLFRPPFRFHLLFEQLYFIGNKSMFIVSLTSIFSGMVMSYQTYLGFQLISGDTIVGPIVAVAMARELAPVLTGLIVAGRAGAAMAAQIGTMKVTEQVDALEVMGIDSVQYLAVPRIIATTLSLPMLSTLFLLIGNFGSWLIGIKVLDIDEYVYFSKLHDFMQLEDIFQGLIKALFFGFIIALVGTFQGFAVSGGAEGVGKRTNLAVVWGMVLVLIVDYFLTSFLVKIL